MTFKIDAATFPTLPPEALQSLTEASRGERLLTLAAALATTPDSALATLAAAARLPVLAEPAIDADSFRLLPARLVHEYQLVPVKNPAASLANPTSPDIGHSSEAEPQAPLHLATPWPATTEIADWIATFTPRALVWHLAPADRVKELIVANYGVGAGSLDDELEALGPDPTATENEADEDAAV
ncbi:MAG: hypothetical protein RL376_696, partial [Verrucomicrobiota bacterium]